MYLHYAYMPIENRGFLVCRARLTQDYLTGYAQELDEIRTVRMAMVQRQEALSVRRAPPVSNSCIVGFSHASTGSTGLLDYSLVPSTYKSSLMLTFGLQELLASEEKNMVRKPELDRERNSVIHLSTAKADCEGIMTSFTFYSLLLVTIQIQRSSSDNSVARLEHTIIFILLGVPHFGPQVSFVSPPATRILLDSDNNSFAFRYPILSGEVIRIHVVFFTNSLQFYLFSFISPSALLLPLYRA